MQRKKRTKPRRKSGSPRLKEEKLEETKEEDPVPQQEPPAEPSTSSSSDSQGEEYSSRPSHLAGQTASADYSEQANQEQTAYGAHGWYSSDDYWR